MLVSVCDPRQSTFSLLKAYSAVSGATPEPILSMMTTTMTRGFGASGRRSEDLARYEEARGEFRRLVEEYRAKRAEGSKRHESALTGRTSRNIVLENLKVKRVRMPHSLATRSEGKKAAFTARSETKPRLNTFIDVKMLYFNAVRRRKPSYYS